MLPPQLDLSGSRREFLRCIAVGSAASMVSGFNWTGTAVAAVQPSRLEENGFLRLRIADFPPLQAEFGAVRLGFTSLGQVSPLQPIIVAKDGPDFFAVTSECTHAGCTIPAFAANKTSTCPCHGSRFGHDGRVIRGPAGSPLPRYDVFTEEPGFVRISLPEVPSYALTIQKVLTPGVQRVVLGFRAMSNVEYEVLAKSSPSDPWQAVGFALTETGAATQKIFKGSSGDKLVYVESGAAGGIFAVSARMKTV